MEVQGDWWDELVGALLDFGEAAGLDDEMWAKREELKQLKYYNPNFSAQVAAGLTLNLLAALARAGGDALTCRFLLDRLVLLEVTSDLTEADLDDFRAVARSTRTIILDLKLNKTKLIEDRLGMFRGCRPFLYLFPATLAAYLSNHPSQLENDLWGKGGKKTVPKVILLVPAREIWLDGPYLAVVGGTRMENWRAAIPQQPPAIERVQFIYDTCRDTLKWQESWLRCLTPLHLEVSGEAQPDDPIANALRVHLINLVILYTADRAVSHADEVVATYAGANQSAQVTLADPGEPVGKISPQDVDSLVQLVEWAYDPHWSADRLALVQIAMAQALHATDPAVRHRLLLLNASSIFESLKWHWKAFIERKVDSYTAQVRALEDYVADTAQAFSDQISAMIKGLSDTMLAAIGALLGSFVAALFKEEFNPIVFLIGMAVYAIYVLAFPLSYNMLNQWEWYQALIEEFEERRRRFEERIYPEKVEKIVGARFAESRDRFKRWFLAISLTYIVVVALVILAALSMPRVLGGAPPSPPTPTPAP